MTNHLRNLNLINRVKDKDKINVVVGDMATMRARNRIRVMIMLRVGVMITIRVRVEDVIRVSSVRGSSDEDRMKGDLTSAGLKKSRIWTKQIGEERSI